MSAAEIISFDKKEINFEDIICVLNPLQSCDLKQVLLMTHVDRRLSVALAFADIDLHQLMVQAGFEGERSSFNRWLINFNSKLPLGVAFRLAKVFGVPVEVLFQSSKYWER